MIPAVNKVQMITVTNIVQMLTEVLTAPAAGNLIQAALVMAAAEVDNFLEDLKATAETLEAAAVVVTAAISHHCD